MLGTFNFFEHDFGSGVPTPLEESPRGILHSLHFMASASHFSYRRLVSWGFVEFFVLSVLAYARHYFVCVNHVTHT